MRLTGMTANGLKMALGLGICVLAGFGCDKDKASNDPESGEAIGPSGGAGASEDAFGEGDVAAEDGAGEELGEGEKVARGEKKKLPKPADPVEKCKGKGKKRECKMVDPTPKVSASHGVQTLMGDFTWGMTPKQVFWLLTDDIEQEYKKRQEGAKEAMAQDDARKWRQDQLQAVKANHTKFTSASKHRWGVSLIQFEYEDDTNEEMLWVKTSAGLRKFYFFKDGELWKIFYAYSTDMWPGKTYAEVVEEKFKKWFGHSPQEKVKQDPKTAEPLLRYFEWEAMDGEKIRSYDLTAVHGVIGLAVVDSKAEARIGERLPNVGKKDGAYEDVVKDALGGSDVCYKDDGTITECSEKEAQGIK